MTPAQRRAVAAIEAELARLIRYDDESVVHEAWIRQRYQGGFAASYAPARSAAVSTAWHEAGHAVAALAVGARFSSASIRAGGSTAGRVDSIQGGCGTGLGRSPTRSAAAAWQAGAPPAATRGGSGSACGTGSAPTRPPPGVT